MTMLQKEMILTYVCLIHIDNRDNSCGNLSNFWPHPKNQLELEISHSSIWYKVKDTNKLHSRYIKESVMSHGTT